VASQGRAERESKFRVSRQFVVPYLAGRDRLHVDGGELVLEAEYWDTPDLRLLSHGHTLRHRVASDGSEAQWTVKLGGAPSSDVLDRTEVDETGPSTAPPQAIVEMLAGVTDGSPVSMVCRMRTRRTRSYVTDANGRRLLTIDDDLVEVMDRGAVAGTFREVELEQSTEPTSARAFASATRRLRAAGAGRPDPVPKLARALGTNSAPRPDALDTSATVEELVRAMLADGRTQLLDHDPGVRARLGAEHVHQARVATRRLRANLRTLRPLLDRHVVEELRGELKWAGAALGSVRDLDVLAGELERVSRQTDGIEATALLSVLDRERAQESDQLADSMASDRWADLLRRLDFTSRVPPLAADVAPSAPARTHARRLLRRSWRRLERRASAATAQGTVELWHETRKAAKSTRYASEMFEPLLGKRARVLARRSKQIQTTLGLQQDALTALAWLRQRAAVAQSAYAAGRLEEEFAAHQPDLDRGWRAVWHDARSAAARI
jgi:CHAD domain-containing protein